MTQKMQPVFAGQPKHSSNVIVWTRRCVEKCCTTVHTILVVGLLAFSLSAVAQAAPAPPPDPSADNSSAVAPLPHQPGCKEIFIAADSNADGKLSRDDAQTMPHVAKQFDAIDTNHESFITRDELRAERARMKAARERCQDERPDDAQTTPPDPSASSANPPQS